MKREHTTKGLLPSGYRQIEYIECTGTQYINTGITGFNEHWKYFFSVELTGNNNIILHGQYNQNANSDRIMSLIASANGFVKGFDYACGGGYTSCSINQINLNTWIDIYETYSSVEINGTTYNLTKYTKTSYKNMLLFAHYFGSTSWTYSKGRCREVIILDNNDNIKLHCYAALRIADSKPGLYDIVNNQFYTNQGTSEFNYN